VFILGDSFPKECRLDLSSIPIHEVNGHKLSLALGIGPLLPGVLLDDSGFDSPISRELVEGVDRSVGICDEGTSASALIQVIANGLY